MLAHKSIDNFFNSAIGTTFAEITTLPICLVKTNYQNSKTNSTTIRNTIQTIYKQGGIKAFFRASFPAISSQIVSTSSKFVFYKKFDSLKIDWSKIDLVNKMINGCMAGICSSVLTHPIEVAKIHNQMNLSIITEIKKQNIILLYRGYSKSFTKAAVGSSLFLPLFDFYNGKINNAFYAAICSAVTSTLIMHPFDYCKTRHISGLSWFSGFNPLPYYKGLSLSFARLVPHFVITMTTIDWIEKNGFSTSEFINSINITKL